MLQVSITDSKTILADDSVAEPVETLCLIEKIIDDLWIDIICFSNVQDLLSVSKSCQHFYSLTNPNDDHRINEYWRLQIINHTKDWKYPFDQSYNETDEWYLFYQELRQLFKDQQIDNKIKLKTDAWPWPTLRTAFRFKYYQIFQYLLFIECLRAKTISDPSYEKEVLYFNREDKFVWSSYKVRDHILHSFSIACGKSKSDIDIVIVQLIVDKLKSLVNIFDINKKFEDDKAENNALLTAACFGHLDIVKILLKEPDYCNVFAKNKIGRTAFQYAARFGYANIVKCIYNHLIENKDIKYSNDDIVQYINDKDKTFGNTAYMLACWGQHKSTIETLINVCNVDIMITDNHGAIGSDYVYFNDQLRQWLKEQENNYNASTTSK